MPARLLILGSGLNIRYATPSAATPKQTSEGYQIHIGFVREADVKLCQLVLCNSAPTSEA